MNSPTIFRTSRLLDFASPKKLIAQVGHGVDEWPLVVIKELVDNALDDCEDHGIAPVVTVRIDEAGITVVDNGPGLPADVVEDILDYTRRVSSREAYVGVTRGAQGNGLSTLITMPHALSGEPGTAEIDSRGIRHEITFSVDPIAQEMAVEHEPHEGTVQFGTSVTIRWPDSARSILDDAVGEIVEITEGCAWLNPHLTLTLEVGEESVWTATDPAWRK